MHANATARAIAEQLRALPIHNAASIRTVRRALSRTIRELPGRDVVNLAVELRSTSAPGSHLVACEIVLHHPLALRTLRTADLERLGRGMASWGEVDTFACLVAGRVWRTGRIADRVIARWATSPDRWWRRAALVSTIPLNVKAQGGTGDSTRTLAICEQLTDDRDDMVVKAMSWALRSLAVPEPDPVADFVDRYERRLAPRVVREVRNKLRTGRKS